MAQDAIQLLDADHQRAEPLSKDFKAAAGNRDAQLALAQTICAELVLHAMVEEEIFYPAYAHATGDQEAVAHAQKEHNELKELIAKVPQAENIDGAMEVIMRRTMHHVEEERREMFAKARVSGMELATVGGRIQTRKAEVADSVQAA